MSVPVVYVDVSEVRPDRLEALKAAMEEMAGFVEAAVPRVLAYGVYFGERGTRMTVVHAHQDSASLERHLSTIGPRLPILSDMLRLVAIDVYGDASERVMEQLRRKAELLGDGTVRLHAPHAGFAHVPAVWPSAHA